MQKQQFIHNVNGDGSKPTNQKDILLSITLIFRRRDGGNIIFLLFLLSKIRRR